MAFHFDTVDEMPEGMRRLYESQYGADGAKKKSTKPKAAPKEPLKEKGGKNKLHAQKVEVDGIVFDSKRESKRYLELRALEAAGKISELRMQVRYSLLPEAREPDTMGPRGGVKRGKVIERGVDYYADFEYIDNETGQRVTEDVKGYRDPQSAAYAKFVLKRKMMLYFHGIRIKEV